MERAWSEALIFVLVRFVFGVDVMLGPLLCVSIFIFILLHLVCAMLAFGAIASSKEAHSRGGDRNDAGDGIPLLALGKDREGATVAT